MADCVFCKIVAGEAPAVATREWPDAIAIRPHHPVAPGHVLVIPRTHVDDVGEDPEVSAAVIRRAAEIAGTYPNVNVITSKGEAATQSVYHLHVHVVPRRFGDGLPLPWTPQQEAPVATDDAEVEFPPGTPVVLDGSGGVTGVVAQHRIKPDLPVEHQDEYRVDWDDGEGCDVWFCGCELVAAPARGGEGDSDG